jgi:hypothetical protein
MKKIKWTILILINIFCELFCLWLLVYFNTFVNDSFIPEKYIWDNDTKRDRPVLTGVLESNLILCGEAVFILFIFYLLNRWLFIDLLGLDKPRMIAKRVFVFSIVFTLLIILITGIQELNN